MITLLKQQGGVLFPGGKRMELQNIRPLPLGYLHAEAETTQEGETLRVAISFGPQYGPVTAIQTDEAIRTARRTGYDILVLAGFSIEAPAQALVQETPIPGLSVHFANVSADVLMEVEEAQGKVSLLKTTRASQIFTVFGQPDVRVEPHKDGTHRVELRGVDIYDPLTGEVQSTRGEDVAAWFLDTDYDGKTFHICQAFFPGDPDAWEKLQRALKAQITPEAFEKMRGTVSLPFRPGKQGQIAVKVIDFRGNEVVRVVKLEAQLKA
jgi:adenine-specific DNA-methyltransferase